MTEEIPYFDDKDYPVREGVPTVERDNINAIVINKTTDEVLCLEWKEFNWKTLIIGGVEDDDPVDAAKKEIEEETGYTNVELIAEVGKTRAAYYAGHKKENRIANATGLLFELKDLTQVDVDESELEKHEYKWIHKDDVTSFLNIESQIYLWEKAQEHLK